MSKKIILYVLFSIHSLGIYSQRSTLELTFTAVDSAAYVQLDSIKVMNRTQGDIAMFNWPDTSLSLEINQGDLLLFVGYATFSTVGILEVSHEDSSFELYQNYPNPLQDQSVISMYIPQKGKVNLMVTDLQGKVVLRTDLQLDGGNHSFRFIPGGCNLYFLTAHWNGISRSIKMITTGQNNGKSSSLDYIGSNTGGPVLKASLQVNDFFVRQSGILDAPEESQTYTFQFATNIPCPGTPTVEYEGQIYNTIQVFSQCWLKENLNIGTMIQGNEEMTDNGIIEKYCNKNNTDSCTIYGGLYQWQEMMQYTTQQGVQGICPPGWHLPTDEEWKVLEGAVDSQYGICDSVWDIGWDYRGYDAGTNLKTTSGWYQNGHGTDLFGFSGMPGGFRDTFIGYFGVIGYYGIWWTSTQDYNFAWYRKLAFGYPEAYRSSGDLEYGYSVRCLRDN